MKEIPNSESAAAPLFCPACRSSAVVTTSKVANADSYWRCAACGEVWNVARLKAGSRYKRDASVWR